MTENDTLDTFSLSQKINWKLKRLSSLLGIIPLGVFVLLHFFDNLGTLGPQGTSSFEGFLGKDAPFRLIIEVVFLYLPLIFHTLYGFASLAMEKVVYYHNVTFTQWRYTLMRITGILSLIFIGYHIYQTRWMSLTAGVETDYLWMVKIFETSWMAPFYLIGGMAVFFHLCNGIWSFCITWGLTLTPDSQNFVLRWSMVLFFLLSLLHLLVVYNFVYHYRQPSEIVQWIYYFIKTHLF